MNNWFKKLITLFRKRRFTANVEILPSHNLVLGTTTAGKTSFLEKMRRNDEAEGRSTFFVQSLDTPVQVQRREEIAQVEKQKAEARLARLREAVWEDLESDEGGSDHIDYCLDEMFGVKNATSSHRRAMVFLMDRETLGEIVKWGADDTEVRGELYEWFKENDSVVRSSLTGVESKL